MPVGIYFLIEVSDWKLEVCNFIKIHSRTSVFLRAFYKFLRTTICSKTCERVLMKLEILKGLLIQFIKKIAYSKTSMQQKMFVKKMFCGKCSFTVIRTNDGNSCKAS